MADASANKSNKSSVRLFVPVTRESLPRVMDKYPFLYLEHGRLEIDDSSIKWIDANGEVIRLPVAVIGCLLLGPGTSITHDAVKVAASANCALMWVGEDNLSFYAYGNTPTATTYNIKRQAILTSDEDVKLKIARELYKTRFPDADLSAKTMQELLGMEGIRQKDFYEQMAQKYGVGWKGRKYVPGKFELSDLTNKIITVLNKYLYAVVTSCVHGMGYTPLLGFIHSGSPLPLVYDLADLYKSYICVEPAFKLTLDLAGEYNKYAVADEFRRKIQEFDLLKQIVQDIDNLLGEKNARRFSK